MNATRPDADAYISKTIKWQEELKKLREVILDCGLNEEVKWGVPCYTLEKRNIVLIHVFKEYCAMLFFKGALITDTNGILIQQTENTRASRQIRFTQLQGILEQESILKTYICQAIEIEKAGLKVNFDKSRVLVYPEEFQAILKNNPLLKTAFKALTPGRQRAYNLYFSAAKQSKTRTSRIEKCMPQILNGKGLHD